MAGNFNILKFLLYCDIYDINILKFLLYCDIIILCYCIIIDIYVCLCYVLNLDSDLQKIVFHKSS